VSHWIADLKEWSSVETALAEVMSASPEEYIGADACCRALGAAEVIAACLDRPGAVPGKLATWVRENRNKCDEKHGRLAEACVRRIDTESELQELFDEGGRNEQWHHNLEELLQRLSG
jgi:hypothetical protein